MTPQERPTSPHSALTWVVNKTLEARSRYPAAAGLASYYQNYHRELVAVTEDCKRNGPVLSDADVMVLLDWMTPESRRPKGVPTVELPRLPNTMESAYFAANYAVAALEAVDDHLGAAILLYRLCDVIDDHNMHLAVESFEECLSHAFQAAKLSRATWDFPRLADGLLKNWKVQKGQLPCTAIFQMTISLPGRFLFFSDRGFIPAFSGKPTRTALLQSIQATAQIVQHHALDRAIIEDMRQCPQHVPMLFESAFSSVATQVTEEVIQGFCSALEVGDRYHRLTNEIFPNVRSIMSSEEIDKLSSMCWTSLAFVQADALVNMGREEEALRSLPNAQGVVDINTLYVDSLAARRLAMLRQTSSLVTWDPKKDEFYQLLESRKTTHNALLFFSTWALGRLRYEQGQREEGLKLMLEAAPLAAHFVPEPGVYYVLAAEAARSLGDFEAVDKLLGRLRATHVPKDAIYAAVLEAEASVDQEKLPHVIDLLSPLLKDESSRSLLSGLSYPRLWIRAIAALGFALGAKGEYEAAKAVLRQAIDLIRSAPPADEEEWSSTAFWIRPWPDDWRKVMEWALEVELRQTDPDIARIYELLQILKLQAQSVTIASSVRLLASAPLNHDDREVFSNLLDELERIDRRLAVVKVDIASLEQTSLERNQLEIEMQNLWLRKSEITPRMESFHEAAWVARGYLVSPSWLQPPPLDILQECLHAWSAVVVELFHISEHWGALILTDGECVLLYPFPNEEQLTEALSFVQYGTDLRPATLERLGRALLSHLAPWLRGKRHLYFAPDGETWLVPFASLQERRWHWLPDWRWLPNCLPLRRSLGEGRTVSCVVSASHFYKLLQNARQLPVSTGKVATPRGIAVGSKGDDDARVLVEALVKSLRSAPEGFLVPEWEILDGQAVTAEAVCSLEGSYDLAVWSWHTDLTGSRHTIADFHLANGYVLSFGRFLAATKLRTRIGLALTCNGARVLDSGATDLSSVAFGLLEAHHARAIVATTHNVEAGAVFLLGRFLIGELISGKPLHKALTLAQRRLRHIKAREIVALLKELQPRVSEIGDFLEAMQTRPDLEKPFAGPEHWASFIILGDQDAKIVR